MLENWDKPLVKKKIILFTICTVQNISDIKIPYEYVKTTTGQDDLGRSFESLYNQIFIIKFLFRNRKFFFLGTVNSYGSSAQSNVLRFI